MQSLLVKSLDKQTSTFELENGCRTVNFCSWERLKPYLVDANGGKPIKGIRIIEQGIEIILKD